MADLGRFRLIEGDGGGGEKHSHFAGGAEDPIFPGSSRRRLLAQSSSPRRMLESMAERPPQEGTCLGGLYTVVEAQHIGGGQHKVLAQILWYGGRVEWAHLTFNGYSLRHETVIAGPERHVRASYDGVVCGLCGEKGAKYGACTPAPESSDEFHAGIPKQRGEMRS